MNSTSGYNFTRASLRGLTVGASKPQQSAMLGDVAVPGGVWSDRQCRKIAIRQRDVTDDWRPSIVVWAVGQYISGERATLRYLTEDIAGDRRALVV